MFSPSRYRSIHYSKFKAAARLLTRLIPAMFHDTHMGPFSPNHTLAELGDFSNLHGSPPGQTSGLGEDVGNHTHDTSRSSDNIKSFNSPDGTRNVAHRW